MAVGMAGMTTMAQVTVRMAIMATATFQMAMAGGNGPCGDPSKVDGNTVNTGRYTISASTDQCGTLTVKDNFTGESFKVWGDPHITTDKGDTTDFQYATATFDLLDGTKITVDPTSSAGVNCRSPPRYGSSSSPLP